MWDAVTEVQSNAHRTCSWTDWLGLRNENSKILPRISAFALGQMIVPLLRRGE